MRNIKPKDCDHCYCGECHTNGKRHVECCMCGARKVSVSTTIAWSDSWTDWLADSHVELSYSDTVDLTC